MKPSKRVKLLNDAVGLQQAGQLTRAIAGYRRYLQYDPDNAGVLHVLGGLYYQVNDPKSAGVLLEQAHKLAPDNTDYLNDVGAFSLMQGNFTDAARYLEQLVRVSPDNPQAHYNHGLALHGAGRLADAVAAFERAVALQPDHAEALYNLGVTFQQLGQFDRALETCRKAVQIAPNLVQAHIKLGEILAEQDRHEAAVEAYTKAVALDRDNPLIVIRLAEILPKAGRTDEGIALLDQTLLTHPGSADLMNAYGRILHIAGRLREAEDCFYKALNLEQVGASLCHNYSRIRKFNPEDSGIIQRMEFLLNDKQLTDHDREKIHYALGKIYDDCKEYDKAFAHYQRANTLQGEHFNYNRATQERWTDNTITFFDRDYFAKHAHLGTRIQRPIFIIGMPRSGTTLTEQILASHPQVAGAGELVYFSCIAGNLPYLLGNKDPYPYFYRALDGHVCEKIISHYLALLDRHSTTDRFVTDKMPFNYQNLGLIRLLFPDAPIIHCRRDPLDVCLSIYFQFFRSEHDYATDLLNIGHKYMQYARLMAHWRKVLPGPFMESRYDELIANQELCSRELVAFCGLDWDESCLAFYNKQRDVRTASDWQVRQPLYSGSVRRWQHYEKYLGPLRKLLEDAQVEL